MNVVGKVGSFLSQGVYSVATPFHPFGGAVDIVVVQQQDGTFRSTPWYVRFGKFQGVLKGAEKIVRVCVNGVEADFHMYLDNSGEAYFVREIDSAEEGRSGGFEEVPDGLRATESFGGYEDRTDGVGRLEHSISDSIAIQVRDEFDSSGVRRIDRAESDADRKFYDFQDEDSFEDGSMEISEYGSSRFGGFDGDNLTESQGSGAEMVLVSVDGHILTAPILASEQNADDLPLNTPQFHLGPGESDDFCEGNEDIDSAADPWESSRVDNVSNHAIDESEKHVTDSKDSTDVVDAARENDEHACQIERPPTNNSDCDGGAQDDVKDTFRRKKREDIFKSCLELPDLADQDDSAESDSPSSPSEADKLPETSPRSLQEVDAYDNKRLDASSKDEVSPSHLLSEERLSSSDVDVGQQSNEIMGGHTRSVSVSNHSDGSQECDLVSTSGLGEAIESSKQVEQPEEESSHHRIAPLGNTESNDEPRTLTTARFEISLCRSELQLGIGLAAAAEAFKVHQVSADEFLNSWESIVQNKNLVVRCRDSYLTWEKAAPIVLGEATFGLEMPIEPKDAIQVEIEETVMPDDSDPVLTPSPSGRRWRLWPIPFRRVKTLQHETSSSPTEELFVDTESSSENVAATLANLDSKSPRKQLVRTNVPTNNQIASLNLKEGQNVVTFNFSTRVLGKQEVDAHIYLWMWNAKIVISDVDGTITKSDVLGQFMPLVGRDWTQSGVARLFSAIKENGYQLLFLSARAIVQAYLTRSFLLNLKQDGKNMPNGPIVISPDGLFPSLYREVIRRAPHEFKIACLEDIKALFPADHNPFYAGFGNRDTDELSYRKIGIPKGKIFIINPKGEVAISHRIDVKSYTSLHTLVNDMFPPTSMVEQEDYNSWNYWKVPIPEIE